MIVEVHCSRNIGDEEEGLVGWFGWLERYGETETERVCEEMHGEFAVCTRRDSCWSFSRKKHMFLFTRYVCFIVINLLT